MDIKLWVECHRLVTRCPELELFEICFLFFVFWNFKTCQLPVACCLLRVDHCPCSNSPSPPTHKLKNLPGNPRRFVSTSYRKECLKRLFYFHLNLCVGLYLIIGSAVFAILARLQNNRKCEHSKGYNNQPLKSSVV